MSMMTHNELKKNVSSFGGALQKIFNLKKNDVVAIILRNCSEYIISLHGTMLVGGIITTINPSSTSYEIEKQLTQSNPRIIITSSEILNNIKFTKKSKNIEIILVDEPKMKDQQSFTSMLKHGTNFNPPEFDPVNDTAIIPFSSGTSGSPKGVELTHYNLVSNMRQIYHTGFYSKEDAGLWLGLLPFHHIYAIASICNLAIKEGKCVNCLQKFEPTTFLHLLEKEKLNKIHIAPPLALFLAKHPMVMDYNLSSLKEITSGAASLSSEITNQLYTRFPGLEIVRQGYGMTELSPVSHLDVDKRECSVPGSVGLLVPNTQMKIVNVESGLETKNGVRGEIWIRGPQVMKGYLNNIEATKKVIDEEKWLHTGDIGHFDNTGHLFVVDRLKELIKVKGYQVSPSELEEILSKHPAILDCAGFQKPCPFSGELPKANVVLKNNIKINPEELRVWVNKHVSKEKHLVEVEVTNEIPRSQSGKILRKYLKEKEEKKYSNFNKKRV